MPARTLLWIGALTFALATAAHAALTISNAKTKNLSCSKDACENSGGNANLNTGELQTLLASSDVTVISNAHAADIGILDPLTWASSHRLTLDAKQSIHIRAPVVVEGTGGVTLINERRTGDYHFNTKTSGSLTFWDTSSSLIINGVNFTLVKDISTLSSDITANPFSSYALAGNYDASADGPYAQSPIDVAFSGTFEGLGNAISNLTINAPAPADRDIGLFSSVTTGGALRDISLTNVSIYTGASSPFVGGLVGSLQDATVSGVSVSGSIVSGYGSEVGGLVGDANGTGRNVISNSHAAVSVNAGKNSFAGGLIGSLVGEATGSWATGSVSIGKSDGSMQPPASAGGLVGYTFTAGSLATGITNCYATGAVSGKSLTNTGGLVGVSYVLISTSYSSGPVHAGHGGAKGGFAGYLSAIDAADDYWDITTSGLTDGVGNQGNIDGVTGLTDAQLKSALPAGFDPNVWGQDPNINNGWPYLLANPPAQ